jgi:predicted NUDIX family phosphoesterase
VEELVLAIPTDDLWKLLPYKETGLIKGNRDVLNRIVQKGLFRRRSALEDDPSFKQIIPYAMISNKESFLLFKRISGQREKRLHNKLHLGAGGHMNPGNSYERNAQYPINELKRELFEEVTLSDGCFIEGIEFIGLINDESIPVSRVHIGLLYHIRVSNKNVVINETDKMKADWIDKLDLADYYEEMETWTKIAFDHHIK